MDAGAQLRLHRAALWTWLALAILACLVCVVAIVTPAPCCGDGSITQFFGILGVPFWAGPTALVLIWLRGGSSGASVAAGIVGVGFGLLWILVFLNILTTIGEQGSPATYVPVLVLGIAYLFAGVAAIRSRPVHDEATDESP